MSFFSKTRIQAKELFFDAFEYLERTYEQAVEVFTPASPFGQLLSVVVNLTELIFYYIESVATELNIFRARNLESIYGLSRLTGHDPTRGISARGVIGIRLNNSADNSFEGEWVEIKNGAEVEIGNNSLSYFLKFDSDFIRLDKSNRDWINVELIQGEIENQTFTGTGLPLQSYNLTTKEITDHFMVTVEVDGKLWEREESLYDMNHKQTAYMCKTGVNGGLSIFFGNNQFGFPPPLGSIITVTYVKTRGSLGNIGGKNLNFKFKEPGLDITGQLIDLNEIISTNIVRNPNFGSDTENPDFTRLIAPYQSKSFVLANPSNYIHYLSKYDFFSFIDAYNTKDDEYLDDDNIVYLFLIPNINKKLTSNTDYFNIDIEQFSMSDDEKNHIIETLNASGRQLISSEVRIIDPNIKKYVLNVVVKWFEGYEKNELIVKIRSVLNRYFLSINRRDSIPRSDLIALIENIEGVDSVNIFFISEENEKAINDGFYFVPVYGYDPVTNQKRLIENKKIVLSDNEDPGLGLDEFGDIKITRDDLAIIRGGFEDRNRVFYQETPDVDSFGSLNIFFKTMIPANIYNKTQQYRFNELRNDKEAKISGGRLSGDNTQKIIKNL